MSYCHQMTKGGKRNKKVLRNKYTVSCLSFFFFKFFSPSSHLDKLFHDSYVSSLPINCSWKDTVRKPTPGGGVGVRVGGGLHAPHAAHTAHQSWPETVPPGAHAGPARRDKHSGRQRTRGPPVRTEGNGGTHSTAPGPRTERLPRLPTSARKHRTLQKGKNTPISPVCTGGGPQYRRTQCYF